MNYREIAFARVGQVAGLERRELKHFVNGIRQGEEDLLLEA